VSVTDQGFATPVHGEDGEQSWLDAIPLAGAGREMTDGNRDPEFIGPQFIGPQFIGPQFIVQVLQSPCAYVEGAR
jgi:hypothetical protein